MPGLLRSAVAGLSWRRVAVWLAVALVHFSLSRLGVALAYHAQDASLVWPAHGFAVAVLLLLGTPLWTALAAASYLSALYSGAPLLSAAIVTAGSVLGPWIGARLLRRADFLRSLARTRDIVLLLAAGCLSAAASATVGVATLTLRGVYAPEQSPMFWFVWWAGDVTGLLAVAPFMLVWATRPRWAGDWQRAGEFVSSLLLGSLAFLVATGGLPAGESRYPLLYVVFPVAIWIAIRFEQHGAVTLALIVSAAAIWETLQGVGPFTSSSPQQTLMYLQAFVTVITGTSLMLAATTAERRESERSQREALERERASREEAQRAAAARDKAIAVVSHEIRNPLGTVLLNATSLLDTAPRGDDDLHFALRSIVVSADQINHVIQDLSDINLLEADRATIRQVPCAPAELVADARDLLSGLVDEQGVGVELRVQPGLPRVLAHPQRVLQVLGNLISNAIRASPPGGRLRVDAWREGDFVWFAVQDHGPGMPESKVEQLMQPFWETPYTHRSQGGLGIPIVRAIVALHGGAIRVDSHEETGCRIAFSLRVANAPHSAAARHLPPPPPAGARPASAGERVAAGAGSPG